MAIEIKNLNVIFKEKNISYNVLENVSCTIPDKSLTKVIGPAGCGKSELMKVILGQERGQSIFLDGKDISSIDEYDRPFAYWGQFDKYGEHNKNGTVKGFVYCDNAGIERGKAKRQKPLFGDEDIQRAAKVFDVDNYLERPSRALSNGQKMRIELLRACLWGYKAYFYDDYSSDRRIDPVLFTQMSEEIPFFIERFNGISFVWISSLSSMNAPMGDHLIALKLGKVIAEGPSDVLCACPPHPIVAKWVWGTTNVITQKEMFRIEGDRQPGENDRLMVSPYGLSFVDEGEKGIQATLEHKYCRGAYTLCKIAIKEMGFSFFQYGPCPFKVGDKVEVDIDPDEVYILRDEDDTLEPIFDR